MPLKEILAILVPRQCVVCGDYVRHNHSILCTSCLVLLPIRIYSDRVNNEMEKRFFGKIPIRSAIAPFLFTPNSIIQQLLHHAKYTSNQSISTWLGLITGRLLASSARFEIIDVVIPVPLHPKKQKQRGFNQALNIAAGICEVLNLPTPSEVVFRKRNNPTQTALSKFERAENSKDLFGVNHPEMIWGQNVLLVDDVCTSGATLSSLGEEVMRYNPTSLSIATVAMA